MSINNKKTGVDFDDLNDLDSRKSQINDLFEDIQNTLDNSVYMKKPDNTETKKSANRPEISESGSISELFDALNNKMSDISSSKPARFKEPEKAENFERPEKTEKPKKSDSKKKPDRAGKFDISEEPEEVGLKISKAIPTAADFDEVKNRNKIKSKPAGSNDLLADTKEVPVKNGAKKTEASQIKKIIDNADDETQTEPGPGDRSETQGNDGVIIETEEEAETEEYDEEYDFDEIQEQYNSDMDLELLKAIGIGQEIGGTEDEPGTGPDDMPDKKKKRKNKSAAKRSVLTTVYKVTNKEYTSRDQAEEIYAAYGKIRGFEFIRLSFGIVLFMFLLYMEIAPYLKWKLPGALNINFYNQPYIWIDIQIIVLIAALNFKSLVYGVRSALASNINVYSISVLFLLVSSAHTLLTLYMRPSNPDVTSANIVLYNSISAYSLVLASLYNLLDINAEISGFKIVSSKKIKYSLNLCDPYKTKSAQPDLPYRSPQPETNLFSEVVSHDTTVGGVLKTPFISNFFSRTYKDKNPGGLIKYFVYIALSASLIIFVISLLFNKGGDWYAPVSSAAALLLGSVPLCSFIITAYPVYKAQKKAYSAGAAFIGGQSIGEASEAAVISIYDRDIFPADQIKTSSIKVYGNNRIDAVLQYLCVAFDKLNMPPADMLRASTHFDKNFDKKVKFVSLGDNGICYISNNKKLFLGNPEYISNTGLIPPFEPNLDPQFIKSSGSIMILASEVEIIAKIYIKYEITADFHDIIKNIKKINACLSIRTFDPNINDELLSKLGNIKNYPVKVLKLKSSKDIYFIPERLDSPVIARDSLKSLINAVVIAGKTKTVMKSNVLVQSIAFGAGLLLTVGLGIFGKITGIHAGHLFLLQSFWMLPIIALLAITPQ